LLSRHSNTGAMSPALFALVIFEKMSPSMPTFYWTVVLLFVLSLSNRDDVCTNVLSCWLRWGLGNFFWPGWPAASVLPNSTSQVARDTALSHRAWPSDGCIFNNPYSSFKTVVSKWHQTTITAILVYFIKYE
jgi:hypothetical protein